MFVYKNLPRQQCFTRIVRHEITPLLSTIWTVLNWTLNPFTLFSAVFSLCSIFQMRHVTLVEADCDKQFNSSFVNDLSQYQTHKLPNEFNKNPHYQMTEVWANVFMIFNFSFILKPFFQKKLTTMVNDGL